MFFFLSCVCYAFVRVYIFVPCGHLLGKGCPLGSRLWCIIVSFSLSIRILGQVWYLILSIPDLCILTYFEHEKSFMPNDIKLFSCSTQVFSGKYWNGRKSFFTLWNKCSRLFLQRFLLKSSFLGISANLSAEYTDLKGLKPVHKVIFSCSTQVSSENRLIWENVFL